MKKRIAVKIILQQYDKFGGFKRKQFLRDKAFVKFKQSFNPYVLVFLIERRGLRKRIKNKTIQARVKGLTKRLIELNKENNINIGDKVIFHCINKVHTGIITRKNQTTFKTVFGVSNKYKITVNDIIKYDKKSSKK